MALQLYQIVVRGSAGPGVQNAFRDFDITVDHDSTRLQAQLMDQAALFGALDRVHALGLEVLEVRRVDRTPDPTHTAAAERDLASIRVEPPE